MTRWIHLATNRCNIWPLQKDIGRISCWKTSCLFFFQINWYLWDFSSRSHASTIWMYIVHFKCTHGIDLGQFRNRSIFLSVSLCQWVQSMAGSLSCLPTDPFGYVCYISTPCKYYILMFIHICDTRLYAIMWARIYYRHYLSKRYSAYGLQYVIADIYRNIICVTIIIFTLTYTYTLTDTRIFPQSTANRG